MRLHTFVGHHTDTHLLVHTHANISCCHLFPFSAFSVVSAPTPPPTGAIYRLHSCWCLLVSPIWYDDVLPDTHTALLFFLFSISSQNTCCYYYYILPLLQCKKWWAIIIIFKNTNINKYTHYHKLITALTYYWKMCRKSWPLSTIRPAMMDESLGCRSMAVDKSQICTLPFRWPVMMKHR